MTSPERTLRLDPGGSLIGVIRVPGDKSISHRALILAALGEGTSTIRGLSTGEDVARTRAAVVALGAEVTDVAPAGDGGRTHLSVTGGRARLAEAADVLDLGNSGTTMRLLCGVCASFPWLSVMTGDASLRSRPMDRVAEPLRRMGASIDGAGGGRRAPLVVRGGPLRGMSHVVDVPSAQVKSAILLAGLGADGPTEVRQPVATRAHTEEMLAASGARVLVEAGGRRVVVEPGPLAPTDTQVPGDPSQAAYWLVGAALAPDSDVVIEDVYTGPARTGFLDVLARMGAMVEPLEGTALRSRYVGRLVATDIAAGEVASLVDEVPVLAVAAAVAEGTSRFEGLGELRVKESDRLAAIARALGALGADVVVDGDALVIAGGSLRGGALDAGGDHRMAMAGAVAALVAAGPVEIAGWESVATSYPGFEEELSACRS